MRLAVQKKYLNPSHEKRGKSQWEKNGQLRQRHAAVALAKITQEAANEAQGGTEATQNGQQHRATKNAGWPTAAKARARHKTATNDNSGHARKPYGRGHLGR